MSRDAPKSDRHRWNASGIASVPAGSSLSSDFSSSDFSEPRCSRAPPLPNPPPPPLPNPRTPHLDSATSSLCLLSSPLYLPDHLRDPPIVSAEP